MSETLLDNIDGGDGEQSTALTTQTPMDLIAIATTSGADIGQLEKLMDLQERWEANAARKAFFAAMAKFQRDCPEIPKRGIVNDKRGQLMYRFAKLDDIIKVISECEAANGFQHSWDQTELDNGAVKITCIISHIDGHERSSSVTIPPTKGMNTNAAQDRGITVKYGKRYSLLNAYGLEPDDDTDGRSPADDPDTLTQEQIDELDTLFSQFDKPAEELNMFLNWMSEVCKAEISGLGGIPRHRFDQAKKAVLSKLERIKDEGR